MIRAIDEYEITGIQTTLSFGKFVMQHEAFRSGNFDTHFVSKYFAADSLKIDNADEALIAAIFGAISFKKQVTLSKSLLNEQTESNWRKNRVNK
ncbi:pyruvate carboxylase subunit A [compost metagenome]